MSAVVAASTRLLSGVAAGVVLLSTACGGSTPAPDAPAESESVEPRASASESDESVAAAEAPEANGPSAIPSKCHQDGDFCTPDPRWVKKLCNDVHPSVALYLFREGTPWTRGYLTRKTKAWNASGGATSGDEWLAFDEEVLLLYARKSDLGGMQVSGAEGGYDALRWDGSCVTLSGEEVTTRTPPKAKHGRINWRFLEEPVQDALRKDETVTTAYRARRKECKGAHSGTVSAKCVKRDEEFMDAVVAAVRGGIELPVPEHRP